MSILFNRSAKKKKYQFDKYLARLFLFSVTSVSMVMSGIASAQDGAGDPIEEVIVSGFRSSLTAALDAKRDSLNAVDSIMAEDIADFPDSNLAESLQRIPGIAITREAGEGRNITVRGLDAKFTRVTMNGAMVQSLAAGSGGAQSNRSFDFNIFASELFSRLDVHKTTSAELEEGSLGATVALQTGRPFDYNPLVLAANVQAAYNDQSGETSPRLSGLVSFKNDDETFGALLSVTYSERFISNIGPQTGRWENDTFASCSGCANAMEEAAVYDAPHPRFPRYADKTHDHERTGITGTLQFAPTESTTITADLMLASVDARRLEPFMQAISLARTGSTGVQETDVADFTIDGNGTLIAATMDGVDTRSEQFIADWTSDFTQFALHLDHDFSDTMRMKAMYTTSKSELDNQETTLALEHFSDGDPRQNVVYAESADSVTYSYASMLSPTISYNWDPTNPLNWEISEFRDRIHDAESGFDTIRLDFEYDFTDSMTFKTGVSLKEYSFEQTQSRADRLFDNADGLDGTEDGIACGINPEVDASMGSVTNAGATSFFIADESSFDMFRASGCWPQAVSAGDARKVVEEDTGIYAQLDFYTDIVGKELRGNVGVRNVTTDLTSTGFTSVEGELLTVTVPHDYTDTLPALNLALDLTDELMARFSWAKVMSRPDLSLLSPGGSVTIFGVPAVSYGNPFLEPYRADNTDLSLEWYFAEDSLLALAYFIKDVESFPDSETVTIPFSATGLPESVLGAQRDDLIDADFNVTRRTNGGGAELTGWELQYQQPFTFLSGWMQNLGMIANYTKVDSEVDETGAPLTGQSDDSYNFTLYYEDDKFSTRLAYSYRGEYFTTSPPTPSATNPNPSTEGVRYRDATTNLDFSASYHVNDNLRLTLEGINLTDEPQIDYMAPGIDRLIETQYTGTVWFIGAGLKY